MASDITTVKSSIANDSALTSTRATLKSGGFGMDFADIIRKSGSRMDGGLNALSDRAGITGVVERSENPPVEDDRPYQRGDDDRDNSFDRRPDTDDYADLDSDRQAPAPSGRADSYDHDRSPERNPVTTETTDNSLDARGDNMDSPDRTREAPDDQAATRDNANGEADATAAAGDNDGDQNALKDRQGGKTGEASATDGDPATAVTAAQMLNSLLSGGQETAVAGQATAQSLNKNQAGAVKPATVEGFNQAVADTGRQAGGDKAFSGQPGAGSQNMQGRSESQPGNRAQTQALNNSGPDPQVAAAQARDGGKAAAQSAELSKMVGNGNNVKVSVSVGDEKPTLVSRPTASLLGNTVLAADSATPTLRNQQSQGNGAANNAGQAQQTAGQSGAAAGQVQPAVQQSAGVQSQSTGTTAIDAKAAAPLNLPAATAQPALPGGGETNASQPAGGTSNTQQTQQTAASQATTASRFSAANQAVVDQVYVQISKAINAGNDRISIQLRPAEMGRVDVQLDIGFDGRVTAVVTADNRNTLDLLQKDSRELQQALQQAGLQVDDDSLNFNLREQGEGREAADETANDKDCNDQRQADELSLEEELAGMGRGDIITANRIDVRA